METFGLIGSILCGVVSIIHTWKAFSTHRNGDVQDGIYHALIAILFSIIAFA